MKKIFAFCVLGCVLVLPIFAQLSVGGYAKSYWIPYRMTVPEKGDTLYTTAVQVPWGEPDIGAGVNFDGWSEWGGIHLGVDIAYGAGNRAAHPSSAKGSGFVWVKPLGFIPAMDTFTIYLGNPNNGTLAGRIGGSNLATYVLNNSYYIHTTNDQRDFRMEKQNPEYNTFTRFNPYSWGNANNPTQNLWWPRVTAAAMVTWEPFERFFIGFFVAPELRDLIANDPWSASIGDVTWGKTESINGDPLRDDDINQDYYDAKQVYRKMQIGAGYTIPGIGFIRTQFIGLRNVIEAAFQLNALGDLVLDFGFKIPFEGTDKEDMSTYKKKRDFQASIAATYRNYDFRLTGRVDTAFAASDSSRVGLPVRQRGLNLIAYLIPSYQFRAGIVGLDLGFEYEQKDDFNNWKDDSMQGGAGLWFARSMGNAQFKAGVVSRIPLDWGGSKQPLDFFIPIVLEAGF
ncbi:MAG: hypothetical protein LBH43_06775 [Treponema sp.]|jgi:hypothetical protein|nr:hypothetical protein [Treponema sp.]